MTTTSDPKASSRLFDIAALDNDGSNFPTWKYRVRTVLEIRGLMSIVNGTEARPVPTANDPKSSEITSWDTRDREAKAQITLTLKDEPLSGVMYSTTSKEAWDKLNERYEGKGKQTIAFLIRDLFRHTLSDDSPLESQINALRQKGYTLASLGMQLDDSLIAIALIASSNSTLSELRLQND